MLVVSIDVGTYSLKILESRVEKKKTIHVNKFEIPLPQNEISEKVSATKIKVAEAKTEKEKELAIEELIPELSFQVKALKEYLSKIPENSKVLIQTPNELTSSRSITVPVKKKNKAEMMIPFQLEEDIPYSVNDVLISNSLEKEKSSFKSLSSFIEKKTFKKLHQYLKDASTHPTYMTTEINSWKSYINKVDELNKSEFVILDIGHSGSRFYLFKDGEFVSYSKSAFGGSQINEMIMEEYSVDLLKAIEFKHKNCFYLTPEQYSDVDDKQKDFALKIDENTRNLVADFKRWQLSLRVNHKVQVQKIYITGGSAKIKNIENYLAQKTGTPIEFTKDWQSQFLSLPIERFEFLSFATANSLSQFYLNRQGSNNFLTGEYAPQKSDDLPLHSISFVSLRAVLLCLLICTGFFVERFFLEKQSTAIDKSLKGALNANALDLTQRDKSVARKKPNVILKKIQAKTKSLQKKINAIEEDSNNIGLLGIFTFLDKVQTPCFIEQYIDTSDGKGEITFSGCESQDIIELDKNVKSLGFKSVSTEKKPNFGNLKVNFEL